MISWADTTMLFFLAMPQSVWPFWKPVATYLLLTLVPNFMVSMTWLKESRWQSKHKRDLLRACWRKFLLEQRKEAVFFNRQHLLLELATGQHMKSRRQLLKTYQPQMPGTNTKRKLLLPLLPIQELLMELRLGTTTSVWTMAVLGLEVMTTSTWVMTTWAGAMTWTDLAILEAMMSLQTRLMTWRLSMKFQVTLAFKCLQQDALQLLVGLLTALTQLITWQPAVLRQQCSCFIVR
mmetsp:Transcript_18450/g.26207  ORF Transcript_18450/g.26207 Transcript_18450/m.26207 type:complete len:235 (-) Transcript_18450:883-1587(-)